MIAYQVKRKWDSINAEKRFFLKEESAIAYLNSLLNEDKQYMENKLAEDEWKNFLLEMREDNCHKDAEYIIDAENQIITKHYAENSLTKTTVTALYLNIDEYGDRYICSMVYYLNEIEIE